MAEQKRYERGYTSSMSADKKKQFKEKFFVRSLRYGIFISVAVLLSIYLDIYLMYFLMTESNHKSKILISTLGFLGVIFVVRQLRYLENIVHFGSHKNLTTGFLNDIIINVVAAIPVLQEVTKYRNFHIIHHAYFDGNNDPCKNRFLFINEFQNGFQSINNIIFIFVKHFPIYAVSYYKSVGSNRKIILLFVIWHTLVFFLIATCISIGFAIFAFTILSVCIFILLPMARFIAEISEHDYFSSNSEHACTFNNLSVFDKLLFHPGGDAYHIVHHLYPTIPWWLQGKAHRFLYENDVNYRIGLHRMQFLQPVARVKGVSL